MSITRERNLRNEYGWNDYYIIPLIFLFFSIIGCGDKSTESNIDGNTDRTPRLALWLANKDELIAQENAGYNLVMTAWFEQAEANTIRSNHPSAKLLAGLTHTWIMDKPGWLEFLITIANGGSIAGPLQITDDMYLMLDDNDDGVLDRKCSPQGWDNIYAMDPRHSGWRELILAFYETVAEQPQHDGIIVDMVDAYSFCEGGWSDGVTTPIDAATWLSAQCELLNLIRDKVPEGRWLIANAGHDFPVGSPFPQYTNGYLLENFLGSWGATLEEGLASAQRALETTEAPHIVVFAVDTDDTGVINWLRFRVGLATSLLMDNTYFAFDYGSRDHGGVTDWWFPEYYEIDLGSPLAAFTLAEGVYRRDFEKGAVVVAAGGNAHVTFDTLYVDIATDDTASQFDITQGDARIFLRQAGH